MKLKIKFTGPTEAMPFFHNVSVDKGNGFFKVMQDGSAEGRGVVPALFPSKEEMVSKITKMGVWK